MLKKISILLVALACICFSANAQLDEGRREAIESVVKDLPRAVTDDVAGIASFIRDNFSNKIEQLYAAYSWIGANIEYDVAKMYDSGFYVDTVDFAKVALETRRGVCLHFAELFNAISNQLGIKSYFVEGYTRQADGTIARIGHAWCANQLDGEWSLFDPTWDAGYIYNGKYVKKQRATYFNASPEIFIKTHMPYDPMWQLLNYTISNDEFYAGKTEVDKSNPYFNYADTLRAYERQDVIERLVSESRRIRDNGVRNSFLEDKLEVNEYNIQVYTMNIYYNNSVVLYNDGVGYYNEFIAYRNDQFEPARPQKAVKAMLKAAEDRLTEAKTMLSGAKYADRTNAKLINTLSDAIDNALNGVREQQEFVDRYFNTKKTSRHSLFYE